MNYKIKFKALTCRGEMVNKTISIEMPEFKEQIRNEISLKKGASHDYYITKTVKSLAAKKDPLIANRFNSKIRDLKAFREQSDYMNVNIDEKKANESFDKSLEIKDIFRSVLNIQI